DQTELGSGGPTAISVTHAGGTGAPISGNGIVLVEVLDKAHSAPGVFTLRGDYTTTGGEQAVVGGAYAYTLHQHGVDGDSADGNWYLRTALPGNAKGSGGSSPRYQP